MSLRVMVIDEDRQRSSLLAGVLREEGYLILESGPWRGNPLARIDARQPDIIVIGMEAPDRETLEWIQFVNARQPRPIVIFAQRGSKEIIAAAIKAGVSAYVVDGLQEHRIVPIMETAMARFAEYRKMRDELESTRAELAERKVIDKAKGIIMRRKGVSENEAYRSLRKAAMDRNERLADVARGVIAADELLG